MKSRRGFALVSALALLALAGALLAGASIASNASARASRTRRAVARAEASSWRELASRLAAWGAREETLPVGAALDLAPRVLEDGDGVPMRARAQVYRLATRRWELSVDVAVGDAAMPLARRRHTLLLERGTDAAEGDSTAAGPLPVAAWTSVAAP